MSKAKIARLLPSTSIQDYLDFFSGLNCRFISVSSSTISINSGEITIEIADNAGYTNGRDWSITYPGAEEPTVLLQQGAETIVACYSDVFLFFTVESSDTNKIVFVYEIVTEDNATAHLYGHSYSAKSGNPDIHGVTLTSSESEATYTHGKLLNYSCENVYPDYYGYIDYANDYLVSSSVITEVVDENTLTCSIVTANKIVTFEGTNYFALGTNTIIPIED